jgi:hypothetical protein
MTLVARALRCSVMIEITLSHHKHRCMRRQQHWPSLEADREGMHLVSLRYCAAMTIDSRTLNQNTGVENAATCNNYILGGGEPINWAYITKSGVSQAPADPLFTGTFSAPNFAAVNPDFNRDLLMSPGDRIRIHLHDTPAGFRADLTDLKTHQSGSMTASVANGFAHVLYTPNAKTCRSAPYAFHPEYSTANPRGNTWSAHTYNLAFSDEIGHFENCLRIDANFNCAVPTDADRETGLDEDDDNSFCVPGVVSAPGSSRGRWAWGPTPATERIGVTSFLPFVLPGTCSSVSPGQRTVRVRDCASWMARRWHDATRQVGRGCNEPPGCVGDASFRVGALGAVARAG